jgi:hypothetical protein
MTHIEIGEMTVEELCIAIDRHLAEAEMHMGTAEALLDVAFSWDTEIEREGRQYGLVQIGTHRIKL